MLFAAARGLTAVPAFAVRPAAPDRWARLCAAVGEGSAQRDGTAERDGFAVAVRDAGFTEVAPGTITCIAVDAAADPPDRIDDQRC